MTDQEILMEDAAEARASLGKPWTVERHDDLEGGIAYEIWCEKPYWRITTICEEDNPAAKATAEVIVRDHNALLPRPLAWDAHANRSYPPVEARAKRIYDSFVYDGPPGTSKPAWQDGSNGLKAEEARAQARDELRAEGHSPI